MDGEWIPIIIIPIIFIVFPWIILHYVTKWKTKTSLTTEDETMLDDLYDLARRLDDRMRTLERILADENPNWNPLGGGGNDRRPALSDERAELDDLESELRAIRGRKSGRTNLSKQERA